MPKVLTFNKHESAFLSTQPRLGLLYDSRHKDKTVSPLWCESIN